MFELVIETDNDAFVEGSGRYEVARILHYLAQKIRETDDNVDEGTLRDHNGNKVGSWSWSGVRKQRRIPCTQK